MNKINITATDSAQTTVSCTFFIKRGRYLYLKHLP